MYEKYSEETKKIINRCHNLAVSQNEYIIGTEHLLLSLFTEPNSSCNILLRELNITEDKITEVIQSIVLFRKGISGLVIYTPSLKQIFEKAITLKNLTNSHLVYEEHLFYTLLEMKDSIAHEVLRRLDIDIEALQDEMVEVMEWELDEIEKEEDESSDPLEPFSFVINLTKAVKEKPLPPLVMRDEVLKRINNIINKRYKRNVLLIGNAGVGKTAIVEGLAASYLKKDSAKQILSLNVNSLISGTKYRGDFEKRIESFLDEIKNKDQYILFIDEIHNVVNQNNLDAGVDLANIIKPALSRDDICCIGATTLSEYHKYIAKDSAFSRRFVKIFVDEPSLEDTIVILSNIKGYYEKYHHVLADEEIIRYICQISDKLITNNHFPDKAIDLLDEACALCKNLGDKKLEKEHINKIINQINNNVLTPYIKKKLKNYPFLIKNFLRYYNANKFDYKPITSILCENISESDLDTFITDLQHIFNIKSEGTKIIDLNNYTEHHSISNLIGAPPGYVGYDNDNTLTKFVGKYQKSIIIFKNLDDPLITIKNMINQILKTGYIEDLSSNKIFFSNSIIVGTSTSNTKTIGYIENGHQAAQTKNVPFPFEHTINKIENDSIESISIDYPTIFKNYLNYLNQLSLTINLDDLYAIDSLTLNDKSLQSLENVISELWILEDSDRELKITYNDTTNEFEICRKTEEHSL